MARSTASRRVGRKGEPASGAGPIWVLRFDVLLDVSGTGISTFVATRRVVMVSAGGLLCATDVGSGAAFWTW